MGNAAFLRRAVIVAALALAPAIARAQDCPLPKLLDSIQMRRTLRGDVDMVPVRVNGTPENFILDTGGFSSQISPAAAEALHLPVRRGRRELFDVRGQVSRDQAQVETFAFGQIEQHTIALQLSPDVRSFDGSVMDGILAPDFLLPYDADMDFGADTLKLFSPDHCPGRVLYWQPPALAVVPITLDGPRISVPVTLDGHGFNAVLDTGASDTVLEQDQAERVFGLTMGAPDTPLNGALNGDPGFRIYLHFFKSLTFGAVAVGDPGIVIIPNAMGQAARSARPYRARRTRTDLGDLPDLIIGMDVLRNMHVYFAFAERKMYITPASPPSGGAPSPIVPAPAAPSLPTMAPSTAAPVPGP